MEEIKLKVKNVVKAYRSANNDGRKLIADLCGEEHKDLFSKSLIERLQTVEDCFEETGNPSVPSFDCVPEKWRQHFQDYYTALVVVEAFNEGESIDVYSNDNRYYPYFLHGGSPSAFRFDDAGYGSTGADAGSGSRLCVKNAETAEAVGKRFNEVFRSLLTR